MTSCTIIVSHFESEKFLRACIRQIRKFANPLVEQKIIICDQSEWSTYHRVYSEYAWSSDVRVIRTEPLYSGFGIDFLIRNEPIDTEYIAQIHCDAFPISIQWLYIPIALIEEYGLSFVGQLQFINGKDNLASIYPPTPFFSMAQCFNVARTEIYRELSLKAGFTRFHNRPQSGLSFENNDWMDWAKDDYERRGSDDDVVAFHWSGKYKTDDMFGLGISGYIESGYGRIIDGIVFHFGSANEARGVMSQMPQRYQEYTRRINENYSDELISEMIELAKQNKPPELQILSRNLWNGTTKESHPTSHELNNRIEELKSTF